MPRGIKDFAYAEYLRLAALSPARLTVEMLKANLAQQEFWVIPDRPPQAVLLSCINPDHRLSLLFGGQPMLIDHLRKPLGELSPVTQEAIALAASAHKVKAVIWMPTLTSSKYHPVEMSNLIATEDTVLDNYFLQATQWHSLHERSEISSPLASGDLLTARLALDHQTHLLSIDSVRMGSNEIGGKMALQHFLKIGQQTEYEIGQQGKEITACTPEAILGLLLWRNRFSDLANWLIPIIPLGCFFTCMDPRICYFGPNSMLGDLPLLIHNMRIPGASFPSACRDAAIYCIQRDNLRILAWISHDSTCAMARLFHDGEAEHIPQLRDHFGQREEHWLEIVNHPMVQNKISSGELIVVRLDLNLEDGSLTLRDYHYEGADRDLLAAWSKS